MKSIVFASVLAMTSIVFAQGAAPAAGSAAPTEAAAPAKMDKKAAKAECQKEGLKGKKLAACVKEKMK
jgi:hypothetical protein